MYFRLNPECYFIKGVKLGAIYDIIEGKIHHLDEYQTKLLCDAEKNIPIPNDDFFLKLNDKCLGTFYDNPPYIQKLREGSRNMFDDLDAPIFIQNVYLEITNYCILDCSFCGGLVKRSFGCLGCNKFNDEKKSNLDYNKITELIDDLERLNCYNLFIKGGDLTFNWNLTLKVINYAKNKFSNIQITFHESQYSNDLIQDIKDDVNVIVQVDSLQNIETYDSCYILLVSDKEFDLPNEFNNSLIERDLIFNNDDKTFMYPSTDFHRFTKNLEYHPCLSNSLAISAQGNVLPCLMMRDVVFGNIYDNHIYDIIHENFKLINYYWKLNLDKINQCKNCEFRYACNDCRALEKSKNNDLFSKTTCKYNPDLGIF